MVAEAVGGRIAASPRSWFVDWLKVRTMRPSAGRDADYGLRVKCYVVRYIGTLPMLGTMGGMRLRISNYFLTDIKIFIACEAMVYKPIA